MRIYPLETWRPAGGPVFHANAAARFPGERRGFIAPPSPGWRDGARDGAEPSVFIAPAGPPL
jgi:hypothetical protein